MTHWKRWEAMPSLKTLDQAPAIASTLILSLAPSVWVPADLELVEEVLEGGDGVVAHAQLLRRRQVHRPHRVHKHLPDVPQSQGHSQTRHSGEDEQGDDGVRVRVSEPAPTS